MRASRALSKLWTKTVNQEVAVRVIGSLALTSVVFYHNLLSIDQCLLLIWKIEGVENWVGATHLTCRPCLTTMSPPSKASSSTPNSMWFSEIGDKLVGDYSELGNMKPLQQEV